MAWVQEIYDTLYDPNTVCVACISHGKDSLAMLRAIKHLGLPLHRIVTTDVWATQDIPAVLPEMWEWKTEADKIIKELYGIEVEHICAMQKTNQATSVFSITPEIAQIFAKLKWIKYIRFACDRKPQIEGLYRAAKMLEEAGIPNSRLFVYVLITKDLDDDLERIYALRKLKGVTIYGMPYVDNRIGEVPEKWQKAMAQKYIYSGQWRKIDWDEWCETHKFYL